MECITICKKIYFFIFIFIFIFIFNSALASPKKILGLYKSTDNCNDKNNPILNHLSNPLKELGYEVDYRDALLDLPSSDEMKQYDGIITFYFNSVHPRAEDYIHWLSNQIIEGRKVIIFGNFGAHSSDGTKWLTTEDLNDFFFYLGLSFKGSQKINPRDIQVSYVLSSIFPSLPDTFPESFAKFNSINKHNKIFLKLSLKDQPDILSCPVIGTPFGGMAQIGYIYSIGKDGTVKWYLDRFNFLKYILSYKSGEKSPSKLLLGLYKSTENDTEDSNLIKKITAEYLFKLGYKLKYLDIEKGFPDEQAMSEYSGLISWYKGPVMNRSSNYCQWLADQILNKKKVIILGNFGAYTERVESGNIKTIRFIVDSEYNNFFYPFGLRMDKFWTSDPNLIQCNYIDTKYMNKELLSVPEDFRNYFRFKSVLETNKPCLTLSRKDVPYSKSDVVVITPYGGMALEGYIYRQDPNTWKINYIINLERFFSDALKEEKFVPPEIFNIHVDVAKELKKSSEKNNNIKVPDVCNNLLSNKVLVLYKKSEGKGYRGSPFYMYAGSVANYLGLICDYIDIESERPDDKIMEKYFAVIAWFTNRGMKGVEGYNNWIIHQLDKGKKVILLGDYGAYYELDTYKFNPDIRQFFERFGLNIGDDYFYTALSLELLHQDLSTARHYENVFSTFQPVTLDFGRIKKKQAFYSDQKVIMKDKDFFDFETELNENTMSPTFLISSDKNNKPLMEVEVGGVGISTPALISPRGGILMGDFFYKVQENKKEAINIDKYQDLLNFDYDDMPSAFDNGKWVVNPFKFFSEALGLNDNPRLDYTTLNGQRIFYTHLDGDGIANISYIPTEYCGEVVTGEIFKFYNLPFTVSVITDDMVRYGSKYYNRPVSEAKTIFSLPNIEVANHTFNHPFNWIGGDVEVTLIHKAHDEDYNIKYIVPKGDKEILYSTALINQNLTPPDKSVALMLWSGKCNPDSNTVEQSYKLGLLNLNGGQPVYDENHKSYSNLSPVYDKVGNNIQVFTSSCNDFLYTDGWTKDYGGMVNLIDHIKHTGSPVRISPINVYYHFYSGMYKEAMDALKTIYDYCLKDPIAPLFASEYCQIVRDFYFSNLGKTDDGGYIVHNMGYLRTIRFDNTHLFLNLDKSEHVLGFNYYNNSLYIFLDENKEHKIYLTDKPQNKTYLQSASHYIDKWYGNSSEITCILRGLGPGYMEIANLKPDSNYNISLGEMVKTLKTSSKGLLNFNYEFKEYNSYRLDVRIK